MQPGVESLLKVLVAGLGNDMNKVTLRPITKANLRECLQLCLKDSQQDLVASNAKSLAEAYVDHNLYPLAIYDGSQLGWEHPSSPMVGFTMYQLEAGVGFILRLMIDAKHQRKGYGEAAMKEVIRRLKLCPEVEIIATSHRDINEGAAALYEKLGFQLWNIKWAEEVEGEIYLVLAEQ